MSDIHQQAYIAVSKERDDLRTQNAQLLHELNEAVREKERDADTLQKAIKGHFEATTERMAIEEQHAEMAVECSVMLTELNDIRQKLHLAEQQNGELREALKRLHASIKSHEANAEFIELWCDGGETALDVCNKALAEVSTHKQGGEAGGPLLINLDDPEVQWILGLMCFQCGPIAHVLARNGHQIEQKAEKEQPYVMTWLLRKYVEFGKRADWRSKVDAELNAMEKAHKEASSHGKEGGK